MKAPNQNKTQRQSLSIACITLAIGLAHCFSLTLLAQEPLRPSIERPQLVLQAGHRGFIYRVAVSADGRTAASSSYDGTIKIWDAQTGDLLDTFEFPHGQDIGFQSDKMVFSDDGRVIEFLKLDWSGDQKTTKLYQYKIEAREFSRFKNSPISICPDQTVQVATAPGGKTAICRRYPDSSSNETGAEYLLSNPESDQMILIIRKNQWFDTPTFKFSPDGLLIAICDEDGKPGVVFWEVPAKRAIRHLENRHFKGFSAVGRMIEMELERYNPYSCRVNACLTLPEREKYGAVELWDRQLMTPQRTLIGRSHFGRSPDGRTILLFNRMKEDSVARVELWDEQLSTLKQTLIGNLGNFMPEIYSPDGRMMALATESNLADRADSAEIILYDLQAGKIIGLLPCGMISSDKIAFSRDGATLTTLNWRGEAKLWDTKTGVLKSSLSLRESFAQHRPKEAAFSADGQVIVSGGDDGGVVIWNFHTGQITRTEVFPQNVTHPSFLAGDRTIIHAEPGLPAMAWDLQNLQASLYAEDDSEKKSDSAYKVSSPDGGLSVRLNSDGKSATLYETKNGKTLGTLAGHSGAITSVLFALDGLSVATVSGLPLNGSSKALLAFASVFAADKKAELDTEVGNLTGDGTIRVWDARTGLIKHTLQGNGVIHEARFLPDGSAIVATYSSKAKTEELLVGPNYYTLWDTHTGKALKTASVEGKGSFLLSPDGALVIVNGREKHLALDVRTGELKWETSEVEISPLNDPFSPDGKYLLTTTKFMDLASAIKLLDLQTGRVRWSFLESGLTSFSSDGRTLVCYSAEKASFLDLGTGQLRWSIERAKTYSFESPLLPGGRLAATFGRHYALELRDALDGRLLVSLMILPGTSLPNDKGEIPPEWIAFTPEGYYTASPGAARYIRWRVGDKLLTAEAYAGEFNRPDLVRQAFQLR